MDLSQIYRIFVFCYVSLLSNLMFIWILTLIPEILAHNYGISDRADRTFYAGIIFTMPMYGNILGAFIWPYVLKVISKRSAILLSLSLQAFLNVFMGFRSALYIFIAVRFLLGACHSMKSVGKDFIFEFSNPDHRLFVFSLKSVTKLFATFIGPLIGYYMYHWANRDFQVSCFYVSMIYLVGICCYLHAFFLNFESMEDDDRPKEETASMKEQTLLIVKEKDETNSELTGINNFGSDLSLQFDNDNESDVNSSSQESMSAIARSRFRKRESRLKKQKGMGEVLKIILDDPYIRTMMLVDFVTSVVFKAATFVTLVFLEESWDNGGLGVSAQTLSTLSFFSFFPAVIILLMGPSIVPKKLSLVVYIRIILVIFALALISIPLIRDMVPGKNHKDYLWITLTAQSIIYLLNPRVYAPLFSYTLNLWADRYSRTALNSISFLISSILSAATLTFTSPFYSFLMYNEKAQEWRPYNKHLTFWIMAVATLWSAIILKVKSREI
jgi:MFS family permease